MFSLSFAFLSFFAKASYQKPGKVRTMDFNKIIRKVLSQKEFQKFYFKITFTKIILLNFHS